MAQGNKSRIVIWTIVGILVVVAVVILVTKPKDTGKPPVDPQRFVHQMDGRFQKLEKKMADAQATNPNAPAEQWQQISQSIAHGRDIMAGMAGLTDQKELSSRRDSVQKAYITAAKALRQITGKGDKGDEEPAGGE